MSRILLNNTTTGLDDISSPVCDACSTMCSRNGRISRPNIFTSLATSITTSISASDSPVYGSKLDSWSLSNTVDMTGSLGSFVFVIEVVAFIDALVVHSHQAANEESCTSVDLWGWKPNNSNSRAVFALLCPKKESSVHMKNALIVSIASTGRSLSPKEFGCVCCCKDIPRIWTVIPKSCSSGVLPCVVDWLAWEAWSVVWPALYPLSRSLTRRTDSLSVSFVKKSSNKVSQVFRKRSGLDWASAVISWIIVDHLSGTSSRICCIKIMAALFLRNAGGCCSPLADDPKW